MKHFLLATAAIAVITSSAQAQNQNAAVRDDVAQLTTDGFLDPRTACPRPTFMPAG